MKILELFSGTGKFSRIMKEQGHEVFTVDNNSKCNPDLCIDVLKLKIEDIPFKPDLYGLHHLALIIHMQREQEHLLLN